MSELLRLANQLVAARDNAIDDGWEPVEWPEGFVPSDSITIFMALSINHAVDIIKGYQDLLRRAAEMLEECSSYGHGLWSQKIDDFVTEIRAPIPQENPNE